MPVAAEIVPKLLMSPEKLLTFATLMPASPAKIAPELLMPPEKLVTELTKMPSCPAEIVPALEMPPAKLGLVYSHTGLRRFIDAIGVARTRELFLLGSYIDAPTAHAWGLVNRVSGAEDLEAVTLELAAELAGNAPLSQTGNKRVIQALLRSESELPADIEQELIELRRASFASMDLREGMRAFAERRAPNWRGD